MVLQTFQFRTMTNVFLQFFRKKQSFAPVGKFLWSCEGSTGCTRNDGVPSKERILKKNILDWPHQDSAGKPKLDLISIVLCFCFIMLFLTVHGFGRNYKIHRILKKLYSINDLSWVTYDHVNEIACTPKRQNRFTISFTPDQVNWPLLQTYVDTENTTGSGFPTFHLRGGYLLVYFVVPVACLSFSSRVLWTFLSSYSV